MSILQSPTRGNNAARTTPVPALDQTTTDDEQLEEVPSIDDDAGAPGEDPTSNRDMGSGGTGADDAVGSDADVDDPGDSGGVA